MPISTTLLLACLTALRLMFFAVAALFVVLAVRTWFDADVAMPAATALLGAAVFAATGFAAGALRGAIRRRTEPR